ncbi:MAG TPA: Hpt domain-containing protein [Geminicoccus sp.]|jgi:HPt (histidine-containing phosphotransfer) domain-containing protein|uniref:Hpt domain-containing protein n=1 Tax=Geminicoccus sp. TaxID=2024832 RepID=UPI002E33B92B|nr:Hpt domain-containing protein [Geminicoccus sp.]HEX2527516.1 Hpt domain-containing protein [Geminicoccus sp.]
MDLGSNARRILLLGVASSTRLLMCHVLQNLGYAVDEATDVAEAAARCRNCGLVVLGLRTASGELRTIVRALRGIDRPPAVMVVGDAAAIAEIQQPDPDIQACLVEPVEFGQFLATVRQLIETACQTGRASTAPVDLERLDMFAGSGPDLTEELAALFFTTARAYLADMENALRNDGDASRTAHTLKGACANFGASEMAALALIAEEQGVTAERLSGLRGALARAEQFMAGAGIYRAAVQ